MPERIVGGVVLPVGYAPILRCTTMTPPLGPTASLGGRECVQRERERALYRLRRLAAATPAAAATAAAPITATTLALFRLRVRPVSFPTASPAATVACFRSFATVFPACLTVF